MKGNILIGQSGGPTAVINASLVGILEGAKEYKLGERVLGMRWGIEGFMREEIVDLGTEDPKTLQALRQTPSSALGSCRYKLKDSDLPQIFELLKQYDIRYLFMIGGNDTMDTIQRIEKYCQAQGYEFYGVGVPKTVDNDLYGTDYTPGYPSAARFVALSVKQAGLLARDMQKVDKYVIHQTVGRDAGWLAAASALARDEQGDPPHLILIPERPLKREIFVQSVKDSIDAYGFAFVVCGEGIVWEDGSPVSASTERDRFANIEFGAMAGTSAALMLHRILKEETGLRGEFQITESLAMCASDRVSNLDQSEAYQCGKIAARYAWEGKTGVMVTLKRKSNQLNSEFGQIGLAEVAIKAKPMPPCYMAGNAFDVSNDFIDYLKPLVGPLPEYGRLSYHMLASERRVSL